MNVTRVNVNITLTHSLLAGLVPHCFLGLVIIRAVLPKRLNLVSTFISFFVSFQFNDLETYQILCRHEVQKKTVLHTLTPQNAHPQTIHQLYSPLLQIPTPLYIPILQFIPTPLNSIYGMLRTNTYSQKKLTFKDGCDLNTQSNALALWKIETDLEKRLHHNQTNLLKINTPLDSYQLYFIWVPPLATSPSLLFSSSTAAQLGKIIGGDNYSRTIDTLGNTLETLQANTPCLTPFYRPGQ